MAFCYSTRGRLRQKRRAESLVLQRLWISNEAWSITGFDLCLCVWVLTWKPEDNGDLVLTLYHMSTREWTQAYGVGSRHPHLLSYLAGTELILFNVNSLMKRRYYGFHSADEKQRAELLTLCSLVIDPAWEERIFVNLWKNVPINSRSPRGNVNLVKLVGGVGEEVTVLVVRTSFC